MARILVVDDDPSICAALCQFLSGEGHETSVASSAQDALAKVEELHPELILLDVRMPGMNGLEALDRIRRIEPKAQVVIMTAYASSETSIEAMRLGAYDCLIKPLDLGVVESVVGRILETQALSAAATLPASDATEEGSRVRLVGQSRRMQEVYKLVGILAARGLPALLVGERGTGKHLVAATIHRRSTVGDGPFVPLSCRFLPEELLAAELFGREEGEGGRGGTVRQRGRIETAAGGSLFVDDIDALSLPLQAKLLRAVTEGTFERVGGIDAVRVGTRFLAGTEKDLGDLVRRGLFNDELFACLRVFSIHLPPLRERREDLPALVAHLIQRCNATLDLSIRGVDDKVAELFARYPWPGNVAELENVIRRATALARSDILTTEDLGDSLQEGWLEDRTEVESALESGVRRAWRQLLGAQGSEPGRPILREVVAKVEETLVREALAQTGGNQLQAAKLLGVTRTTLREKMRLSGLTSRPKTDSTDS